jgi:hypothetical protein
MPQLAFALPDMALRCGLSLISDTLEMMKIATRPLQFGLQSFGSCGDSCGVPSKCHSGFAKLRGTTDIKLEAELDERRIIKFLVENNRSREETITFKARSWIDAYGREFDATQTVNFSPASGTLKPGESVGVQAVIEISKKFFEPGMAYFTEFVLEGCPAKPISVGLLVYPQDRYVHYAVCEPCRRRHGRFVEFCGTGCGCGSSSCGCGCDPHHHWYDTCSCNWYYLPPRPKSQFKPVEVTPVVDVTPHQ